MEYLFIYLGVGALISISALLHNIIERDKSLVAFVAILLLWPVIIFVVPELILGARDFREETEEEKDSLKENIINCLSSHGSLEISGEEKKRIKSVAMYGYDEVCTFSKSANFKDIIEKLWTIDLHPKIYNSYFRSIDSLVEVDGVAGDEHFRPEHLARFSRAPRAPEWSVGFSNEFVKSILKIDRKKQGRILEAISKIADAPLELRGDTIKPLSGNLDGLWRCRLGNDRLIYSLDLKTKTIVLIAFSARSEVYET